MAVYPPPRAKSQVKNVHTSGFGLAIAKQTVDVHNGKIYGISDGRDKGSTFFVELPVDFTSVVKND